MPVAAYYLHDPAAPRPNSPTRMGTNVLLERRGRLVLVRDDTLLRPGQTYLLGLVERDGVKLVIPVGGDRPLTSSPGQSTPWTDYPAVASMLTALEAIAPSPGWEDVLQAHGSLPRLG